MKRHTIRNFSVGILTGLTALVSGGCPPPVDLIPVSLPTEDSVTGDRPTEIYEGDINRAVEQRNIQDGFIDGVFDFRISPQYDGQPVAPVVTPLRGGEGELLPFKVSVKYDIDASGWVTGGQLILTDNNIQSFRDGAPYRIDMTAATFICRGYSSPTEQIVIKYNRGISPANLTDLVDDLISEEPSPPQPLYVVGDGICNTANGETHQNSPKDCPALPQPPAYTIGDGKCDTNLGEPADSEDCIPPTYDLVTTEASAYFVNPATGQPMDPIITNPATMRLAMSERLEKRLAQTPTILRTEENGSSNCLDIDNYTTLTRTSSGVYDTAVTFDVNVGCLQDEVVAVAFSLRDKEGNDYEPIYGSAFVPYNLPQAP